MTSRYSMGPLSPRTIEMMSRGCTEKQWLRQCTEGAQLEMIDEDGAIITGQDLFVRFKHLCRKEES